MYLNQNQENRKTSANAERRGLHKEMDRKAYQRSRMHCYGKPQASKHPELTSILLTNPGWTQVGHQLKEKMRVFTTVDEWPASA